MYRASKALSVVQARDYYQREYSRGDYYEHDTRERKGEWYGKAADRLGLQGEVSRPDFHALLEGKSRAGGEQLIAGEASTEKHRAGWDFTASADKSVSLMALVEGDERVTDAHRRAVDRSLGELERYVQAKDHFRDRETTGELVAAKFEHESSRKLDPQLHTHVVVMNMTRRSDGKWRALEPREMFAAQKLVTATYRAEIARELQRLGYPVEVRADGSVGIAGFTKEQLDHFSQRRAQIERYLQRHGVAGAAHAERAARTTRRAKVRDVDRGAVVDAWRTRAKEQGLDLANIRRRASGEPARLRVVVERAPEEALRSVAHAIEHVSERKAVFHGREMDTQALMHGMGRVTLDDVRSAASGEGSLIDIEDRTAPSGRFTTWDTLRLEERTVALMREGRGRGVSVIDEAVAAVSRSSPALSPDQERVARHILLSRDQVVGIEGKAGTGKTHTLGAVREMAASAGWRVRGLAPTTGAVKLLREAGVEAVTVTALQQEPAQAVARRELWIVDEAGMLSTRQAAAVLERAREVDARVVLVGDSRQHAGVEAGHPFRYLTDAGMSVECLDQICRQRNEVLRQAVRDASQGRTRDALSRLAQDGRVVEVKGTLERHRAIAEAVANGRDKQTLVIAPSNEERRQLNHLIRERLIDGGRVERVSVKVPIAIDKGLTRPELRVVRNYQPGDQVRFTRGSKEHGLEPRTEGRVIATDAEANRITVELRDGRRVEFDLRDVKGASVAKVEERRFAMGDRVQFRAPDRGQRIANGQLGTVRAIDQERAIVELGGGRRVDLDLSRPQVLDHGYASTSHAAQGQSVDRVIVAVDTEQSAALVNQQQFYVSISRAREEALVFTDSRADLARAVSRQAEKVSALDYVREKEMSHARRPEPGRAGRPTDPADRVAREPAAPQRARGRERRPDAGARAPAPADRRGEDLGRTAQRPSAPDRVPDGADRGLSPSTERGTGARDAPGFRERGEELGRDGGPVSGAGGRRLSPGDGRVVPPRTGEAGDQWLHRGRSVGSGADDVRARAAQGIAAVDGSHVRDAGTGEDRPVSTALPERARPPEGAARILRWMKIRDEEHRALEGVLPPDLVNPAVRLNVISRELGAQRVVTPAHVDQIGVEGIRSVVAWRDPKQAALALARALLARARDQEVDRDR